MTQMQTVGDYLFDVVGLPPAPQANIITDNFEPDRITDADIAKNLERKGQIPTPELIALERAGLNRGNLTPAERLRAAQIVSEVQKGGPYGFIESVTPANMLDVLEGGTGGPGTLQVLKQTAVGSIKKLGSGLETVGDIATGKSVFANIAILTALVSVVYVVAKKGIS